MSETHEESIDEVRQLQILVSNAENLQQYGFFIHDQVENVGLGIPFYKTVYEGHNLDANWKDQACVRMSHIHWRNDRTVTWLERHMEMTQAFFVVGKNPGLFVLGEPTHNREDLDEKQRALPDPTNVKAFIVPAGCGIIIKKGTWHDFPVSCGPPVTCFIINTEEVVNALANCPAPMPMNDGDCYKLRLSEHWNFTLKFPDPRPFVESQGLVSNPIAKLQMGVEGYGHGMLRSEVSHGWGQGKHVYVIPVVNVEVFKPGCGGPGIQPHLKSIPEIANKGWRDYGNRSGLQRLSTMFKQLEVTATAVINSEAAALKSIAEQLKQSGWELGAHGTNNSEGNASMTRAEEEATFKKCIKDLTDHLGVQPRTWLTPGFSITERTPEIAASSGIEVLLDFVDDDVPFNLTHEENGTAILCLPYCMETNDFSLALTKNLDPQKYAEAIEYHVRQLAAEPGEKVVCLGMHTFVAGTPARVYALKQALARLKNLSEVCFATASEVHDLIKENELRAQMHAL